MILRIIRGYKSGSSKRKILVYFSEAFENLRKRKTCYEFPYCRYCCLLLLSR